MFLSIILILCLLIHLFNSYKYIANYSTRYKAQRVANLYAGGALNKPPLELCDENMLIVMNEVKDELGTIFGYDPASREVGITGK